MTDNSMSLQTLQVNQSMMNIYTTYIKCCVALITPFLDALSAISGPPDGLTFMVLMVLLAALSTMFPMTMFFVSSLLTLAFVSMLVDICCVARLL